MTTSSAGSRKASKPSRKQLEQRVIARRELDRRQCAKEPARFIERHCMIEDPDGTVVPFTLWPFQRDVLQALHRGDPVIVLKARRLGLSWVVLAFALWLAVTSQGIRVLILCKTEADATELLDRIRRMRDRISADPLHAHLLARLEKPAKERDAVTTLDIGSSTIRALVGTPAAARSETAGLVIADEFAFQRRADEIWRALLPTIDGGGRIAVVSTGNGPEQHPVGGEYASLWARAVAGVNGLTAFFFPWQARPDRDEAWKQRTMAALGDPERFKVEYPEEPGDAFLAPDATLVYDATHLAAAEKLGAHFDSLPTDERPNGPVWLGIDWGVHSHVLFARPLPGGGLWVFDEVHDEGRDLDVVIDQVVAKVQAHGITVVQERFDAAEPIIHTAFRKGVLARLGYNPRWGAVPFSKYKAWAVKYAQLALRRTYEDSDLGPLAISPACSELLRQLARLERDPVTDKVVKGDDHGADALLTLTAELGERHFKTTQPSD